MEDYVFRIEPLRIPANHIIDSIEISGDDEDGEPILIMRNNLMHGGLRITKPVRVEVKCRKVEHGHE